MDSQSEKFEMKKKKLKITLSADKKRENFKL